MSQHEERAPQSEDQHIFMEECSYGCMGPPWDVVYIWIASALASGVLGNAGYQFLVACTKRFMARPLDREKKPARVLLDHADAVMLAKYALALAYKYGKSNRLIDPEALVEVDSERRDLGWFVRLSFEGRTICLAVPHVDPRDMRVILDQFDSKGVAAQIALSTVGITPSVREGR